MKKKVKEELNIVESSEEELRRLRMLFWLMERASWGSDVSSDLKELPENEHSKCVESVVGLRKELRSEKDSVYHLRFLLYLQYYREVTDFLHKYNISVHEGAVSWALQDLVKKVSYFPGYYDPYGISKSNKYWIVAIRGQNDHEFTIKHLRQNKEEAALLCEDETYFIGSFNLWKGLNTSDPNLDDICWPKREK